jgi:hypothetical protein
LVEKPEFDRVNEIQETARERERLRALKQEKDNAEYRQKLKHENWMKRNIWKNLRMANLSNWNESAQ